MGGCCGKSATLDDDGPLRGGGAGRRLGGDPGTDVDARQQAANAAALRQQKFEQSATGRAAIKATKAAQEKPKGRQDQQAGLQWQVG
ncbi:hypothetical protein KFL_003360150 [Klebsormidium nitens]|uniref:Uncharacterized protein n=1 Tax=Klebsormidium nitens TaxID=105231 RepID=A0A1Y1I9F2_KLENI|nr:hypothetical protein KFL_003360150 [Klebsormidium nitens]|eukprot:GAQ87183.1 hypothetical protein KFL_003360150 [Klebsormidium nitens]